MADDVDRYQYYYRGEDVPEAIERIFDGYDRMRGTTAVLALQNPVIAGGACRSWAMGKKPTDIDMYLTTKEDLGKVITDDDSAPVFKVVWGQYGSIDIINHVFDDLESILNTFDMTVTMCAVNSEVLVCHKNYLADLASRSIVFTNLSKPMNSLIRLQKYIKYGFTAHPRELTELAIAFYLMNEEPKIPDFARDPVTGHFVLEYKAGTNIPF